MARRPGEDGMDPEDDTVDSATAGPVDGGARGFGRPEQTSLAGALDVGSEVAAPPGAGALLGNVVSPETSPSFFALQFRLNAGKETHPGRFVAVEARTADGRDALVLARVDDVHEVNPHEDALSSTLRNVLPFETKYAAEGASTVIYRVG